MRKICTGILAAALALGLFALEPAQAKVYKMAPEEREAALKEKKAKRAQAKKSGKAAPGQEQGGWVEVKPGERPAKKSKKASVDELAKAAEKKGKKSKGDKAPDKADKAPKAEKKGKKKAAEEPVVEKKGKKKTAEEPVAEKKGKKSKTGKKAAAQGDRLVGSSFVGERKVPASSTEVRRSGDDLNSFSVSRPGQDKPAPAPEVRQEVQPGPVDAAKPVGTEHKAGEGRF